MSIKKRLVQAGAGLALAGLFVSVNTNEAEAASWQPRTVSEIKTEIENQASGQEGTIEYTFTWGDTLWGISEATGISVNKLAQVNNIENSSLITVGNSIFLSNDSSVLSVEDENKEIKSYDVSEEEVKETETPKEVQEQAAQPKAPAQEAVQAEAAAQAEQQAAREAAEAEQAAAAQAQKAEQQAAEQAVQEQAAREAAEAEQVAAAQAQKAEQQAAEQAVQEQAAREAAEAEQAAAAQAQLAEQQASTSSNQAAPAQSSSSGEHAAKEWIAQRESGGDYNAVNPSGKYIGRYQLTNSYLGGDHSPANQERVANNYVQSRYGSWQAAKSFWEANGWY